KLELSSRLIALNARISKHVGNHQYRQALHLFVRIHASPDLSPDHFSLSTALTACARLRARCAGAQLHSYALRSGFLLSHPSVANSLLSFYSKSHGPATALRIFNSIPSPDDYTCTTLLSAYVKSGHLSQALQLFDEMPQRNTPVWNSMITGFIDIGHQDIGLELFSVMLQLGVRLDKYSFVSVMTLCDSADCLGLARQLHSMVVKTGFVVCMVSVVNALVTMYFECGLAEEALAVFGEAAIRDEISYNAVIAGLVKWGRDEEALLVFKEMIKEGCFMPTGMTIVSVLSACLTKKVGMQVHALAIRTGLDASLLVGNAFVGMYSDCGDIVSAQQAFGMICDKDSVSWNSIISAYCQQDCHETAIELYDQMLRDGCEPDEFTFGSLLACATALEYVMMIQAVVFKKGLSWRIEISNSMISAYSKCGDIDSSYQVFSNILFGNLVSWNSIIAGFLLNGFPKKAIELFSTMLKLGLKPNTCTLSTMLSTSASILAIRYGKELHGYIIKSTTDCSTSLHNTLISMYAKCGDLNSSEKVFHKMSQKDVVSWNSTIAAYGQNGNGYKAIQHFKAMQTSNVLPDKVTFTIVLSACSHAGLVDEGHLLFTSMSENYGLEPGLDHFSCIIDLLGRAGHLDEAEKILNNIPCGVDVQIWWSLLSACSIHGNARLGRIAANSILKLEPDNAAVYVLLSNLNAVAGKWEEASNVREDMRKNGVIKKPGFSWI
ncbi:TPR-like protein, partial [Dioscorea alata]